MMRIFRYTLILLLLITSKSAFGYDKFAPGVYAYVNYPIFFDRKSGSWKEGNATDMVLEVLTRPYIEGYTYIISWKVLEPQEGTYNWFFIDKVLLEVGKRKKKMNLMIWLQEKPQWIMNDPEIEKMSFRKIKLGETRPSKIKSVFPLDPIFLKKYYKFVNMLADHTVKGTKIKFKDHPALQTIGVGGPSNGSGLETFLKSDKSDYKYIRTKLKKLSGFSDFSEGLASFWIDAIEKYTKAFPKKYLSLNTSVGHVGHYPQGFKGYKTDKVAKKIITQLKKEKKTFVKLMMFNLTGKNWWDYKKSNPVAKILRLQKEATKDGFTIGYQMTGIAGASKDKEKKVRPFKAALEKATDIGAQWIEIFIEDLMLDRTYLKKNRRWLSRRHPFYDKFIQYVQIASEKIKKNRSTHLKGSLNNAF